MVSGLEENLRGAVKQKIGVARKALDDSAALRKWLDGAVRQHLRHFRGWPRS
jgi:hypothetical protein